MANPKLIRPPRTRILHNHTFPGDFSDLDAHLWFIQQGPEYLAQHKLSLFDIYRATQSILWPDDDHHRWSDLALKTMCDNEITVLMGCGDCVSGDTMIPNPKTGENPTIKELCEKNLRPTVQTLRGPILADIPYLKGHDELFEVRLDNGGCFKATGQHRVLTSSGFARVSSLRIGDGIRGYDSAHKIKVVSIRSVGFGDYYDIQVPGAHHYFSGGAVHHNSNKTYSMSRFILVDWWAFPNNTLWLISSTEYRGAELRIWGKLKELFNRARNLFPHLPGNVLESLHAITTEAIGEGDYQENARSLQKGLIFVPCKRGSTFVGLSAFVGIKSERLRHAGDETQHMSPGFLDAYANWYGKRDFKGVMSGNPTDPTDPLCTAAEPANGWDSFTDTEKTQTWRSRFFNAAVVAFDGRDSPNNDFPGKKLKYHYLISAKKLDAVANSFGTDSWQWYNQCVGKPPRSMSLWRVVTRQICEDHDAFSDATWRGSAPNVMIYAIDPAYGGGDRCVGGAVEFGPDAEGRSILKIHPPEIIPISLKLKMEPEDQISTFVKRRLSDFSIPPQNCFYDSFGRGTLGYAFARAFGEVCPVPIDSGGPPSQRPVRYDLYTDTPNGKRLKTANEHYSKRISELWFSVREAIESDQIRELPKNVLEEGCLRTFKIVKGNRIEVEPKDDMKDRIGRSPDLFDWLAIAVEGARHRGFQIKRIGASLHSANPKSNWLDKFTTEYRQFMQKRELTTS